MKSIYEILNNNSYWSNIYKWFRIIANNTFHPVYNIYSLDWRLLYQWNFKNKLEAKKYISLYFEELNDLKSY